MVVGVTVVSQRIDGIVTAEIIDCEVIDTVTLYIVEVTTVSGLCWRIPRRFRAFEALSSDLREARVEFKIPRKHVWRGRFYRSKTVEEERREALGLALAQLISKPGALAHPTVKSFFSMDQAFYTYRYRYHSS